MQKLHHFINSNRFPVPANMIKESLRLLFRKQAIPKNLNADSFENCANSDSSIHVETIQLRKSELKGLTKPFIPNIDEKPRAVSDTWLSATPSGLRTNRKIFFVFRSCICRCQQSPIVPLIAFAVEKVIHRDKKRLNPSQNSQCTRQHNSPEISVSQHPRKLVLDGLSDLQLNRADFYSYPPKKHIKWIRISPRQKNFGWSAAYGMLCLEYKNTFINANIWNETEEKYFSPTAFSSSRSSYNYFWKFILFQSFLK